MGKIAETPLMLQYLEMKKKHPDALLLFRVGDFYETFSDDAIAASEILGITLTRRANGKSQSVELAGFPHHALDTYLPKLVRAGRRVAICEQLEDPKLTKKLVKRGITELVTPGVNTSPGALDANTNNFLAAVHIDKGKVGLALLDISTGEFLCTQGTPEEINRVLNSYDPKELLRMKGSKYFCEENFNYKGSVFELDDWVFTMQSGRERLLKQFDTTTLKGFGVEGMPLAIIAAGAIMHYLDLTVHNNISHVTSLTRIDSSNVMHLDPFTVRNLELVSSYAGDRGPSLFRVINLTSSPPGTRLLGRMILNPLLDIDKIKERHDAVEALLDNMEMRDEARRAVKGTGDLERLAGRVASSKILPREMLQLSHSIVCAMKLREIFSGSSSEVLRDIARNMPDILEIASTISEMINPETTNSFGKGEVIAAGVSQELDELRHLRESGKEAIHAIQSREIEKTGIPSLKISFNNVFGYYIEVRNTHRDKVPADWVRKQTLVNAERYVTPELKEYEEKITGAEERIAVLESEIYRNLIMSISRHFPEIHKVASGIALSDCLISFADVAERYNYVRPVVDDSTVIEISEGRHPVIERNLPPGEPYISNSVTLDSNAVEEDAAGCQIMMITGPNMSGKSALLRQTALIVLMAQIGSFVPAKAARIGLVDKIFTRVGASDNISSGESTFMVEMNEAASILNNMSSRSLILFDELGRGTSTYDGISIAWSIVEHIHDNGRCTPRTLFATHYHELNEMETKFRRIKNYNVSVREIGQKIVFLRKLAEGGSEHSFGIHVARLAGMPRSIVNRAERVLHQLEKGENGAESSKGVAKTLASDIANQTDAVQMSFFNLDDPLLSQIRDRLIDVDVNNLTPIQALNMLNVLQGLITGK